MTNVLKMADYKKVELSPSDDDGRAAYRRLSDKKLADALEALARGKPLTMHQRGLLFLAARKGQQQVTA